MAGTTIAYIVFFGALVAYTIFALWRNIKNGRTLGQIIMDILDEIGL